MQRVVVVGGVSPLDRTLFGLAAADARTLAGRVEFEFWTNRPVAELRPAAAALPAHTAVFFVSMQRDVAGQTFHSVQIAQLLSASGAPVYVMFDTMLGQGPVGGAVVDFASVGRRAGQMAARVLEGESPGEIPIEIRTNGVPMFDWKAMRRAGVSESRLPPGSVVRFRPPTLWAEHKDYILGGLWKRPGNDSFLPA